MAKPQQQIPPDLLKIAADAFGNEKTARAWFRKSQAFTVHIRPDEAMQTPRGRKAIQAYLLALVRINEGIIS